MYGTTLLVWFIGCFVACHLIHYIFKCLVSWILCLLDCVVARIRLLSEAQFNAALAVHSAAFPLASALLMSGYLQDVISFSAGQTVLPCWANQPTRQYTPNQTNQTAGIPMQQTMQPTAHHLLCDGCVAHGFEPLY